MLRGSGSVGSGKEKFLFADGWRIFLGKNESLGGQARASCESLLSDFLVATLTLVIFLALAVACLTTLIVATRTASEGFEDEVGFHRVKVPQALAPEESDKRS